MNFSMETWRNKNLCVNAMGLDARKRRLRVSQSVEANMRVTNPFVSNPLIHGISNSSSQTAKKNCASLSASRERLLSRGFTLSTWRKIDANGYEEIK